MTIHIQIPPAQTGDPEVDAFNRDNMVGAFVRYWTGDRDGAGKVSTTRTLAQLLSGHTPVVWVDGHGACIALTHVEPVPHQPDDIDEQGNDIPDPMRAVERVRAYVTEYGDGLYDVTGDAPLYGRDLEALCRAVERLASALDGIAEYAEEHAASAKAADMPIASVLTSIANTAQQARRPSRG